MGMTERAFMLGNGNPSNASDVCNNSNFCLTGPWFLKVGNHCYTINPCFIDLSLTDWTPQTSSVPFENIKHIGFMRVCLG